MSGGGGGGGSRDRDWEDQFDTAGMTYNPSTLPYKEYAESIDFNYGRSIDDVNREELFRKYVQSGGTWTPGASGGAGDMTIQPFMAPHIQGLLGQQLAAGFGGQASDYASPLYQPMKIPNYAAGAPLFPKSKSTSKDRDDDDDD